MPLSTDSLRKAGLAAATRAYTGLRQIQFRQQAQAVLRAVESERGRTAPAALRQADAYAREVLGSLLYAPWLHVYTAIRGGFREGWIPDNYYGVVVDRSKCGGATRVALTKSFTGRILATDALPDLAYVIDGVYYGRDYRPITRDRLLQVLFANEPQVVFKSDSSFQGRGVTFLTREAIPPAGAAGLPDGVFQAPIRQHAVLAAMSPRAIATLRITTARELDGRVSVRAAYLRLGRANDAIVSSHSHVRVAVNLADGTLADTGYLSDWRRTATHPDTGVRFDGQALPGFAAATGLCQSLHESCPHMPCLGWDLSIDQAGHPQIMEWNARYNDIKFSEATTGPCFVGLGWEHLWRRAAA